MLDVTKDLKENFLNYVSGIARIGHQPVDQIVHWRLEPHDQCFICRFVAPLQRGGKLRAVQGKVSCVRH